MNHLNIDILSVVTLVVGAFMVYGSGIILKIIKAENDQKKMLAIKSIGLGIAAIGFLRLFEII